MKTSKTAILAAAFGMTMAATSAQAGNDIKVTALDESRPTKLCVTAANGHTVGMLLAVQNSGWSMNFVRKNVSCNGESIGQFAAKYGSDGVQKLLPPTFGVKIIDLAKANAYSGKILVSK